MLSGISRALTYACAVLYAILGVLLYFLPESLAPVFAWKVTPFMTMTIGGWCLGNAWLAWMTARRRAWRLVNGLTAILGVFDWLRIQPARERFGPEMTGLQRGAAVAFVIFVGFLGVYGLIAQIGWPGTQGGIFPEEMSAFTLRSFAAFYFSLAVAAIPLVRERNRAVLLNHGLVNYGLILFITAAAFIYIRLFDFAERPGGLLYFGAYLVVGIPLLFLFAKYGTGLATQEIASPLRGSQHRT
jgi:hypothetical protein